MLLAGIIVTGVGVLVVGIGLIFIIPYKNVKRFASNKVQGRIIDMVWNAAMYNEPLESAAGVEHFQIAGMEMQPGTREQGMNPFVTRETAGDAQNDPNRVVVGRGTVNMFHKVYQYEVDGREYTRADGVRYNKGAVQSWIGKTVNVYYNPENPQQSTLSNGSGYKITMIILYIAGGLIMLVGLALLLMGSVFWMF